MARRRARATSLRAHMKIVYAALTCLAVGLLPSLADAGLYSPSDQILVLGPENVDAVLVNSSAAVLVEFYASWCGHCVSFSPVYKSLARDIREWRPAMSLAAVDCALEANRQLCTRYGITGYPSIKFFHAYSSSNATGLALRGFPRQVRGLRQRIIDLMETHQEQWPPACPPLEPISQLEVDGFFKTNSVEHLALIFEEAQSYVGREVTLDLLQYDNVAVRRVLRSEEALVSRLQATQFPSCYVVHATGGPTRLAVQVEARVFYSYALQRLPGVVRSGKPLPVSPELQSNSSMDPWRPFNISRVYMADLESTLHYSLRVELSAHPTITGLPLSALRAYISVLAKYFPGRAMVVNLLRSLDLWLQGHHADELSYLQLKEKLDNSEQVPDAALPMGVRWVGCQGSQAHLRRYPCGVWTLFHVLTVHAHKSALAGPQEVLQAMRGYVQHFFGCRHCAQHFEAMAAESLTAVASSSASVLWLWTRHNRVNSRLAGDLSEDPLFPKTQWPLPDLCPRCHSVLTSGEHFWDVGSVLSFLLTHFSCDRLLPDFLDPESRLLEEQQERLHARRAGRIGREAPNPSQPPLEEEETGDELSDWSTWSGGRVRRRGVWRAAPPEDIVDLDSFVQQLYRQQPSSRGRRSLQRQVEEGEGRGPGVGEAPPLLGLSQLDLSLWGALYLLSCCCLLLLCRASRPRWPRPPACLP